jgi:hypothetical protein
MEFSPSMVLIAFPVFLLYAFRAHAGVLFFAACAGLVTVGTLDVAVVAAAGSAVPREGEAYVRLTVIMFTMIFGALWSNHYSGKSGKFLHLVIALLVGVMLWLLAPPSSGVSWLVDGVTNRSWEIVNSFRTLIIAVAFSLSLLTIPKKKPAHSKKKSSEH